MFRRGDWVVTQGNQIAVITELNGPNATIHMIAADGTTVEQQGGGHRWDVPAHIDSLRLAESHELPESRRYPGEAEELRLSADLLAAAAPPVPGDTAPPAA